jgi:translocation and assembly module TamA
VEWRARSRRLLRCGWALAFGAVAGFARADVAITGLDEAQLANVLAYLDFDEEACDAPAWRVEQLYQGAPRRIRDALQALGYYDPRVTPTFERDDACWHAKFDVDAGTPVIVRGLDVRLTGEAANDATFAAARQQSPLTAGLPLHHGDYEALKRRWSDLARERGYADAMFTENRIDVYPDQRAADIVLHFESGKRYRFGEIQFQQDVLSDEVIRSYPTIHAGDPYDGGQLTALYAALADSGYFRNIEIRPQVANRETGEIPIDIVLEGAPRRQITYGVGFSTDTGPRFRFSRANRRFNDKGHQFGVAAQISPVISEFTANYRMPLRNPRTEWLSFDAGIKSENTDTSESDTLQIGARRVMRTRNNWVRTQMLSWLVEDFTVADQEGRSRLLMPGIAWTRVLADNTIRPNRGTKLELELRGASDTVGSDTSFVQAIARGRWIWSTSELARILFRTELGATEEESFDELPPSVRFFAGGDNSVRGYDFEALGPVDENGEVIGGSSLAVASIEYEHRVKARWSVAVFVDSGNAFESSHFDTKTGAGIGTRWQSPLGPIRVDVAHPFDDTEDRWRLHITLGPDL